MKRNKEAIPIFLLLTLVFLIFSCKKDDEQADTPLFESVEIGEVDLNLIYNSSSSVNMDVLIFQINLADTIGADAVAWKVIKNTGQQSNHPFHFADWIEGNVNDEFGNYTPKIEMIHGFMYEAAYDSSGILFHHHGESQCFQIFSIVNHYTTDIESNIYRDGKRLGTKYIPKGAYGRFEFEHSIYITWFEGDFPYQEGDVFPLNPVWDKVVKFDLTGIESADIIMTGNPMEGVSFVMKNIKYIQ